MKPRVCCQWRSTQRNTFAKLQFSTLFVLDANCALANAFKCQIHLIPKTSDTSLCVYLKNQKYNSLYREAELQTTTAAPSSSPTVFAMDIRSTCTVIYSTIPWALTSLKRMKTNDIVTFRNSFERLDLICYVLYCKMANRSTTQHKM